MRSRSVHIVYDCFMVWPMFRLSLFVFGTLGWKFATITNILSYSTHVFLLSVNLKKIQIIFSERFSDSIHRQIS